MTRYDLRPVEVSIRTIVNNKQSVEIKSGFFHIFTKYGNEDGFDTYALVEFLDGATKEVNPTNVKFID